MLLLFGDLFPAVSSAKDDVDSYCPSELIGQWETSRVLAHLERRADQRRVGGMFATNWLKNTMHIHPYLLSYLQAGL